MRRRSRFAISYAPAVKEHLHAIEPQHLSMIRATIEEQLRFEPGVETRNRKPLRPGSVIGAEWELRCGPGNRFRVFYEIHPASRLVRILGVGEKQRNRLILGGEEIDE